MSDIKREVQDCVSWDIDFTGVTIGPGKVYGFIPTYYVYLPSKVVTQLGQAKDVIGACNSLGGYIIGLFVKPLAVWIGAGLILLAAWLAAHLYDITWTDKGDGVTLILHAIAIIPYWDVKPGNLINDDD